VSCRLATCTTREMGANRFVEVVAQAQKKRKGPGKKGGGEKVGLYKGTGGPWPEKGGANRKNKQREGTTTGGKTLYATAGDTGGEGGGGGRGKRAEKGPDQGGTNLFQ